MNKFESRPSTPNLDTNAGWIVQVYGSNRRLLFVLEPSHAWVFFIGCGVGLLFSLLWIIAPRHTPPLEPVSPQESSLLHLD